MSSSAVLAVVGLLALFTALSVFLRRYARSASRASAGIEVLGQRRLGPEAQVWLLEIDGQRLLVGGGREGLRLIAHLPRDYSEPPEPTGPEPPERPEPQEEAER